MDLYEKCAYNHTCIKAFTERKKCAHACARHIHTAARVFAYTLQWQTQQISARFTKNTENNEQDIFHHERRIIPLYKIPL